MTACPPPLPVAAARVPRPEPSFTGALRGIWLFTWRPQAAWRRLPILLVGLLALPTLVYLTTPSMRAGPRRDAGLGDPSLPVNQFSRQLERAGNPLTVEQRGQMLAIFSEEFARMNTALVEGQSAD